MAQVGLVIREKVEAAIPLGLEVIAWLKKEGHDVIIEDNTAIILGAGGTGVNPRELAREASPIITLGGDGTLIGVARYVEHGSPVMIGVNFGNLGFLTEIAPTELLTVLTEFFEGRCQFGRRNMIHAEVERQGRTVFSSQAVNDAVVQKGAKDPLVELDINVDGEAVMRLRADGVIVATPTGSTAYSLAAGGSIAYPSLDVVLVTPICPHSLTMRPLILPLHATVGVRVPRYEGEVLLSIDGQVSVPLSEGDLVKIRRSQNTVQFVRSPSRSYFEILRRKLNWGIANQAG